MSKRRMLSSEIIETDSFCCLPPSAQVLYLHLNMNADDDGIVDKWKSLLRYLSLRTSHLQALIDLDLVMILDSGVLLITDWLTHNRIRQDRYVPGRYKNELDTLGVHKNGRYFKASEDFLTTK